MQDKIKSDPYSKHIIIDVGAKFVANRSLFQQAFENQECNVFYLPVRPNDCPSDRIYNDASYVEARDGNFTAFTPFFGKVQDMDINYWLLKIGADITEVKIHYLLIDVHYYLSDWQPIPGQLIYTVGANFPLLPGDYVLPANEGTFSITVSNENWNEKM